MGVNMTSLFKYLSARSSLVEIKKTIEAMGGRDECSPIILAQEEMTEGETTYYYYKFISDVIHSLVFVILLVASYGVYDGI